MTGVAIRQEPGSVAASARPAALKPALTVVASREGEPSEAASFAWELELDALYRAHGASLRSHCRSLLGSAHEANDAVHEAFERVLRARPRSIISRQGALYYLFRTATNTCIDLLRQRGSQRRAEPEMRSRTSDSQRVQPAHAERHDARALLERCDERTARIGLMRFVHEMNQEEIAAELGLSRRSVFSRLKKLEHIAAELERSEERRSATTRC